MVILILVSKQKSKLSQQVCQISTRMLKISTPIKLLCTFCNDVLFVRIGVDHAGCGVLTIMSYVNDVMWLIDRCFS